MYHPVKVVTGKNDNVLNILVLYIFKEPGVLTDGVCCSLKPLLATKTRCLSSSKYFNKSIPSIHYAVPEVVCSSEMAVQGH